MTDLRNAEDAAGGSGYQRAKACQAILRVPDAGEYWTCSLEPGHSGLHTATYDFERITGQVMIDGGRLWQHTWLAITWHTDSRSSVEVGKDSPEWRESLKR